MKLLSILALALAIPCWAQTGNTAQVFSGKDITSQLASLAPAAVTAGSSGATLGNYTSHAIQLSVRTASGGAEVHASADDIFFVTQGKATLITGGTVVNAKTDSKGETHGSRIDGGTRMTIAKGDVVHIPAGTPHQLLISPKDVYSSIVVKVQEPPKVP